MYSLRFEKLHLRLQSFKTLRCSFHLAALIGIPYSNEAPTDYIKTNIAGTLNVLEA